MEIVLGLAWLACGPLSALHARRKDRDPRPWFVFGAILGPLAIALLFMAPPGHCGICLLPVRGWGMTCARCGHDVRQLPTLATIPSPVPTIEYASRWTARSPGDVAASRPATAPELPSLPAVHPTWASADHPVAEVNKRARRKRRTNGAKPAPPPVTIEPAPSAMPGVLAQPPSISPLLLSGVFVGGTVPLLPGSRYSLVVEDGELKVLGPVDVAPNRTVVSRPAVGIEIDSIGDRLTIAQRGGRATGIGLVFTAVVGASAGQLEQAIATAEAGAPAPNRATLQ